MAHRASFRRSGISQSQRRKKTWGSLKIETTASPSTTNAAFTTSIKLRSNIVIGASTAAGNMRKGYLGLVSEGVSAGVGDELSTLPEECTILRARGSLLFPKTEVGTGTEVDTQQVFGFGVTDIRSIVNAAAPHPGLDPDWDGWMFLRQSAVAPVDSVGSIVDVKAMRKIQTGDAFFVAVTSMNIGASGAVAAADWIFDLRLLILLP